MSDPAPPVDTVEVADLDTFKAIYPEFLVEVGSPVARPTKYSDDRITETLLEMRNIFDYDERGVLAGTAHILYIGRPDPLKPPHEGRGTTKKFEASELSVERITQADGKPHNSYWARSPYGETFIEIRDRVYRDSKIVFS